MSDKPETIAIPKWVKRGSMMANRDTLSHNDPDHTYNYVKDTLGLRPEDYGITHPLTEKYSHLSRDELIDLIVSMEQEIEFMCTPF